MLRELEVCNEVTRLEVDKRDDVDAVFRLRD